MHNVLTIMAHIEAKPEQIELVKSELLKLIEPTRKEAGCINYDLHQDRDRPEIFKFYENWESRALWQTHMGSAHLKDYVKAVDGAVVDFVVNEMALIS